MGFKLIRKPSPVVVAPVALPYLPSPFVAPLPQAQPWPRTPIDGIPYWQVFQTYTSSASAGEIVRLR